MTWQLIWRNARVAALNATLQLLIIYRFEKDPYISLEIPTMLKLQIKWDRKRE